MTTTSVDAAVAVASIQRDLEQAALLIERANRRIAHGMAGGSGQQLLRDLRLTQLQQQLLAVSVGTPHAAQPPPAPAPAHPDHPPVNHMESACVQSTSKKRSDSPTMQPARNVEQTIAVALSPGGAHVQHRSPVNPSTTLSTKVARLFANHTTQNGAASCSPMGKPLSTSRCSCQYTSGKSYPNSHLLRRMCGVAGVHFQRM